MTRVQPGIDGVRLPVGTLVFRIGESAHLSPEAKRQKKAMAIMFRPTTADRESKSKCISVWVEDLTLPDEAWSMMGARPKNTVVACLNSEKIRSVVPPSGLAPMDLQWDRDESLGNHPGSDGHAGLWGLVQGDGLPGKKTKLHELQSQLADIARISPTPVPHNLENEAVAVAAYYFAMRHRPCSCTNEQHWVEGVRKLRRIRAIDVAADTLAVPSANGTGHEGLEKRVSARLEDATSETTARR
jgi:hypothetical protein